MQVRRGIVKSFDAGTYRAKVQLAGSLGVWLEGVPVARNIASGEMAVGRSCLVVFFDDDANPSDAVLAGVYV